MNDRKRGRLVFDGDPIEIADMSEEDLVRLRYRMLCFGVGELQDPQDPEGRTVAAMGASELHALRLRHLAEEIGKLYCDAPKYGWKTMVARRFGMDPSYMNRLLKGDRSTVGTDALDAAALAVPISREYFSRLDFMPSYEVGPVDLDWRPFFEGQGKIADPSESKPQQTMLTTLGAAFARADRNSQKIVGRSLIVGVLDAPIVAPALQALQATSEEARSAALYRLAAEAQASPAAPAKLRVRLSREDLIVGRVEKSGARVCKERRDGTWVTLQEDTVPNVEYYWRMIAEGSLELLPWTISLDS